MKTSQSRSSGSQIGRPTALERASERALECRCDGARRWFDRVLRLRGRSCESSRLVSTCEKGNCLQEIKAAAPLKPSERPTIPMSYGSDEKTPTKPPSKR